MNGHSSIEMLMYQDLAPLIEAELFDPLPAGLVDPAWLELPEIEAGWLELPEIEPAWLELPEIEPEWLAAIEHKHLEIEQAVVEIEMEQDFEKRSIEDLNLEFS